MKQKVIIFLIAGAAFLSAFSGLTALLAPAPDAAGPSPSVIARGDPDNGPDGNSWGG